VRYKKAFDFMLENEGGDSYHPRDKGKGTRNGVSVVWHPIIYYKLFKAKSKAAVSNILFYFYLKKFWDPLYDKIKNEEIAIRLFDVGVNVGKRTSVKIIQRTANGVGCDLRVDGKFGCLTLVAINRFAPIIFYAQFKSLIRLHYESLDDYDVFGRGWINRLNKKIPEDFTIHDWMKI
tara:strand:- start:423 stop:953 length:531 start_codon:yes stop_codon:yes gene_type:complete